MPWDEYRFWLTRSTHISLTFPTSRKMNKITGMTLAAVLVLNGCGGSGGGGSSPAAALPASTSTSVSGTAAKGIIKQARVLVCRIVNGVPEPDASCASTTTGNDGSYSVAFSDGYNGPAMVKVMAGSASTMMDETTNQTNKDMVSPFPKPF